MDIPRQHDLLLLQEITGQLDGDRNDHGSPLARDIDRRADPINA